MFTSPTAGSSKYFNEIRAASCSRYGCDVELGMTLFSITHEYKLWHGPNPEHVKILPRQIWMQPAASLAQIFADWLVSIHEYQKSLEESYE